MKTSDFDYELPQEKIAQAPAPIRDACRLLTLDKRTGAIEDRVFRDIYGMLEPKDLLVANETRVLPARLLGRKRGTNGNAEVFLLRECADNEPRTNRVAFWEALVKPGKRLKPGSGAIVDIADSAGDMLMSVEIIDWARNAGKGERKVKLSTTLDSLDDALHRIGRTPLPPYIRDYTGDAEMYQTVYSNRERSAAAPTAGLHFTDELIGRIREKGVGFETVDLEVGLDTFRVIDEDDTDSHKMHTEYYSVPAKTVEAVLRCKEEGGRVVAVGTTSVRSLESAASRDGGFGAVCRAQTSMYIQPGYSFKIVDALITNFHVPRSTLMVLVSALAGRDNIMRAYEHALAGDYRFLSFGDAMFIH